MVENRLLLDIRQLHTEYWLTYLASHTTGSFAAVCVRVCVAAAGAVRTPPRSSTIHSVWCGVVQQWLQAIIHWVGVWWPAPRATHTYIRHKNPSVLCVVCNVVVASFFFFIPNFLGVCARDLAAPRSRPRGTASFVGETAILVSTSLTVLRRYRASDRPLPVKLAERSAPQDFALLRICACLRLSGPQTVLGSG